MTKDSLGDRMKGYENISRIYLTRRTPVILRLDGKSFHSFTRGFKKPFDDILITSMQETAKYLCQNITGCKLAYTQSDEISLLLVDYDTIDTQPWFDNNLQKLVSVAASMTTMAFNKLFESNANWWLSDYYEAWHTDEEEDKQAATYQEAIEKGAMFDARAFILPKEEVCNYFIWRQQDATRNSIQMVAQSQFSHKELQGKNCNMLQDMLHEQRDINWNDYATVYKRGSCIVKVQEEIGCVSSFDLNDRTDEPIYRSKWVIDKEIPIFTQDRNYIDRYVFSGDNK